MAVAERIDAIVVGGGPNGLVGAITLARAGLAVRVYEAAPTVGGGAQTGELTLPGFRHDICSAVHPLGAGSPVLRSLPLHEHGLSWIQPELPLAHPLPGASAAVLSRSIDETTASLADDGGRYRRLVGPFADRWDELAAEALRPVLGTMPRHPLLLARFGVIGILPASTLARRMRGAGTRALLAGLAAHAIAPLTSPATGGTAMLFALAAHAVGWPIPLGGSQSIADALASYLRALGGEIVTGVRVGSLDELPAASAYLLDVAPWNVEAIAGRRLPTRYLERLRRYRHAPGVFKLDFALDGPVPWTDETCSRAGTVHIGASFEEIAAALSAATTGRLPDPPFLIAAQPSLFDATRAPEGKHTFWVYAHVPFGWDGDFSEAIERQIEHFAPGFRDRVLARAATGPAELEARNANNIGGDIAGGAFSGLQTFFRPVLAAVPYATPDRTVYLCSSATPPGPGVHGMCGYHAARVALRRVFGRGATASSTL
ncbi:MAG: NAD(P)/FAD-dependent oxidoreductase [Chloroflexi bacterium]|nr:MAG: NAD(P)/FAD-dependent oxidoreductase [Chloroflexota bacterium]